MKKEYLRGSSIRAKDGKGFTLIEVLISSSIMLIVIVASLSVYNKSNKIALDQTNYSQLQSEVRSALYFINRDIRSAGVGLNEMAAPFYMEGIDAFGPGPEYSDSIKLLGNFDYPLVLKIKSYDGENKIDLEKYEGLNSPYDADFFENKIVMLISLTEENSFVLKRVEKAIDWHDEVAKIECYEETLGLAGPCGINDTDSDKDVFADGLLTFGQIKQYWVDTSGNPNDYPSLNLEINKKGYLGIPFILYVSTIGPDGQASHMPVAQNIENFQMRYNTDMDEDGLLDGFADWDTAWLNEGSPSIDPLTDQIRQVRIWIVGRTDKQARGVRNVTNHDSISNFRSPAIANVTLPGAVDLHRRFILSSTASIRNLSLSVYNETSTAYEE